MFQVVEDSMSKATEEVDADVDRRDIREVCDETW
jgi:hypothetical protein